MRTFESGSHGRRCGAAVALALASAARALGRPLKILGSGLGFREATPAQKPNVGTVLQTSGPHVDIYMYRRGRLGKRDSAECLRVFQDLCSSSFFRVCGLKGS